MKLSNFSGPSKFFAGVIAGAMLFSGSAIAVDRYVSDNTPENGYLLCANKKTKAVSFPNKLTCPAGTIALDLGAAEGQVGPAGQNGADGKQGPPGSTGAQGPQGPSLNLPNYVITAGSKSVNASIANKADVVLLQRAGMEPGWYSVGGQVAGIFANTTQQVILCTVTVNGNVTHVSMPNIEAGALWRGFDAVFSGMLKINAATDLLVVRCSFTGNAQVTLTSITLAGIQNVIGLDSY